MMENYDNDYWENTKCPKYDCRKNSCKCGLKKVFLAAALGDDGKDSSIAPKNGAYCNAIVVYEANNHVYIYSKEGIPTLVETGGNDVENIIKQLENQLAQEILNRQSADDTLQEEIDAIKNSPDVVDIVPTYVALQAYDTSSLGDNDIIRVLQDEQHDGQSTYYRWDKHNSTWVYIGAVGDYYTKGQVDTLLAGKQNTLTAGANITINANNEISATDTTYTHFTGATASTDGVQGLVPGPLAGDEDKFLKANGTWDTVQAGPTVVQTAGTSTTDVMSQNAATSMVFADPSTQQKIKIGASAFTPVGDDAVEIGKESKAKGLGTVAIGSSATVDSFANYGLAIGSNTTSFGDNAIAIGYSSGTNNEKAVALGRGAQANHSFSVALGAGATTSVAGEINVGTGSTYTTKGYNGTNYRLISGVYDPVNAHDAATKGYVDANAGGDTVYSTKTTSDSSIGGAVYIGNLDANQVEQADPTTTDNHYKYFWALPGLGSSVPKSYSVNILGSNCNDEGVVIGHGATNGIGYYATAIGSYATVRSEKGVAIGSSAYVDSNLANSVALGSRSFPTRAGEVNVGNSISQGYNNTNYRIIGGVHDGQDLHDAATVAQGNTLASAAPDTSTVGVLGQLWTDTTNMHTYQCTAISGSTYTWTQRW